MDGFLAKKIVRLCKRIECLIETSDGELDIHKSVDALFRGRIWTMVAGGGASVIYSDTICALGGAEELANYGEYSGAPSEQQTYDYAKTLLSLMTREELVNWSRIKRAS